MVEENARTKDHQADALLAVENLTVDFHTDKGRVRAVNGVSFVVPHGKTLGVVGESGCGKSVTAMSIMQLIPTPPGQYVEGRISFRGKNLLDITNKERQELRGNHVSMIFQEPMTSLNPVFTVGNQIMEAIQTHQKLSKGESRKKAIDMLRLVGIPAPEERIDVFPHQLSGGMRQRVMIAMALACEPELLIADEPTTALDVTIQAQILKLLRRLQHELGMSIIFITHDLGVVAETCDDVQVMYAGRIVEKAPVKQIFSDPKHPYTLGLLRSIPSWSLLNPHAAETKAVPQNRLSTIPGVVPNLLELPTGCSFQDRCERVSDLCRTTEPELVQISRSQEVRCHHPNESSVGNVAHSEVSVHTNDASSANSQEVQ